MKTEFSKNDFFKTCFSKTSPNTKTRYLTLLKHSVYGYDPLHKHDEISMCWPKVTITRFSVF